MAYPACVLCDLCTQSKKLVDKDVDATAAAADTSSELSSMQCDVINAALQAIAGKATLWTQDTDGAVFVMSSNLISNRLGHGPARDPKLTCHMGIEGLMSVKSCNSYQNQFTCTNIYFCNIQYVYNLSSLCFLFARAA